MNPFPYMPLYPRDLMADPHVRAMRLEEFGAYIRLLTAAWDEEQVGTLPNDDETLANYAGAPIALWLRMRVRVLRPFRASEDGVRLEQKRMMEEYEKLLSKVETYSKAGQKAAQARWSKRSQCDGNAIAMRSVCDDDANQNQNQNHTASLDAVNTPLPPRGDELDSERPKLKVRRKAGNSIADPEIAALYAAYPRHENPDEAAVAIGKAIERQHQAFSDREAALAYLTERTRLYAASWQGASAEERTFIPHPPTWFNKNRFNNDPKTWEAAKHGRNRSSNGADRVEGTANAGRAGEYRVARPAIYDADPDQGAP